MPLISRVGRKHPRVRALHAAMYIVLILGAVTMVYPFLVMLSGSTKSGVDGREYDAVPRFWFDDDVLYRKHIEGLFNERLSLMQATYDTDASSFEAIDPPADLPLPLVDAWRDFAQQPGLPHYLHGLGYIEARVSLTVPHLLREFKRDLIRRYNNNIEQLNRDLETEFVGWNAFFYVPEDYLPRSNPFRDEGVTAAYLAFKARQPAAFRYYFSVEGFYKAMFLKTQYTRSIEDYNATHGTGYASYADVRLPARVPEQGTELEKEDWERFVRHSLHLLWVRVDPSATGDYREFLAAKYGDIDALNRNYGTDHPSFDNVPLIEEPPADGLALSDWAAFIAGWSDPDTGDQYQPTVRELSITGAEFLFREFLEMRYGTVPAMNQALGTAFDSIAEVKPPQQADHYLSFLDRRGSLRWEFSSRNYKTVTDFMVLHGRGIVNTVIYCLLAVLSALIVNPLAAYAMSRYRLPSTYKILLFMLIVMAFPPMVTQIPMFLMLRDFNLLNTFAALILPGMAHGYSIFLLKGFFDSLPRELYETAEIDGANEWSIFWRITMSLSQPILAVVALSAFNMAYANFMFALLVCQDTQMWTLMVWLYQLQMRSGTAVVYASLIIAAIPTFVIFLFCQNIIMRGIVVPVEK